MNHIITFTGDNITNINCNIIYKISTTINLSMIKIPLTAGLIAWRDMGISYDRFATSLTLETDIQNAYIYETRMKHPDRVSLTSFNGVYPFTPLFDYSSAVEFVYDTSKYDIVKDHFGNVNQYNGLIIPAYKDLYSVLPVLTGSETDCYAATTTWSLDSMNLPDPIGKFKLSNIPKKNGLALNGNYSCVDRNIIPYNEIATVKVKVDKEACTKLLNLLTTKRNGVYNMVSSTLSAPFGQQYKDSTQFSVQLADTKIVVDHLNYNIFNVSFKLQLLEAL